MKEERLEPEQKDGKNDARGKRAELSTSQTTVATTATEASFSVPAPISSRATYYSTKKTSFKRFRFRRMSRASKAALYSSSNGGHGKESSSGGDFDYGYNKNVYYKDDYSEDDSDCPLRRALEIVGFI